MLQISKTKKLNNDEATYFRIIGDKTASLLSTCCEIGALSATEDTAKVRALKEYGEYLGIAFQIRDDILDYIGSSKIIGKTPGRDIKDKKLTLPLIYALSQASKDDSKQILKFVKSGEKNKNVADVIEFVKNKGGLDYSDRIANEYGEKAVNSLNIFDDSDSRQALIGLVEFVLKRKN